MRRPITNRYYNICPAHKKVAIKAHIVDRRRNQRARTAKSVCMHQPRGSNLTAHQSNRSRRGRPWWKGSGGCARMPPHAYVCTREESASRDQRGMRLIKADFAAHGRDMDWRAGLSTSDTEAAGLPGGVGHGGSLRRLRQPLEKVGSNAYRKPVARPIARRGSERRPHASPAWL